MAHHPFVPWTSLTPPSLLLNAPATRQRRGAVVYVTPALVPKTGEVWTATANSTQVAMELVQAPAAPMGDPRSVLGTGKRLILP